MEAEGHVRSPFRCVAAFVRVRKKAALTKGSAHLKHAGTQRTDVENDEGVEVDVNLLTMKSSRAGGARSAESPKSRGPHGQTPKLGVPREFRERVDASIWRGAARSRPAGRVGPLGFVLETLEALSRVNRD